MPTVFAYFRTREELCGAVLDAIAGFYEDMADSYHRSDRPAARALLDNMLAFAASVDNHPDHARILLDWSTAIREDVWPLYLEFYDRMVKRLEATIRRGQEEGTSNTRSESKNRKMCIVKIFSAAEQPPFHLLIG